MREFRRIANPTMKDSILSLVRHALTGLAGLGGFLASKSLVDAGDAAAVNAAGASLAEAMAVILAAMLARLVIYAVARFSPSSNSQANGWAWVCCIGVAGTAAVGTLSSCSSYPITGSIMYRDPGSGAKAGLAFSPGKLPAASLKYPIFDPDTGDLIGMADLAGAPQVIAEK